MAPQAKPEDTSSQQTSTEAILTLIGSIIIRLSNGIVLIWGSTNLYYLSYLHHQGCHITSSTNSHFLLASTIPIAILTLLAAKLANKFGYEFIVRLCAFIFLLSPLLINYLKGIIPFVIFYMILPGAAFTISTIPLLNIMITQFPKYKTRVNSLMVICLGISTFVTNCVFSLLANPHNQSPQSINGFELFSKDVGNNVLKVNNRITVVCGVLFVIGSMMLKQKRENAMSLIVVQQQNLQTDKLPIDNNNNNEILQNHTAHNVDDTKKRPSLCSSVMSLAFVCLFLIAIINGLFPNYITSYFKIIFMSIVNNDYILTCLLASYSAANIIGAIFWGWLADKYGVAKGIIILISLDILIKMMSFGLENRIIMYVFIPLSGLLDKGTVTVISPGLVELFGISRGTQLMPIRQLSTVLSFSILPIGQLLTKNYMSFYGLLKVIAVVNILSIAPAIVIFISEKMTKKSQQRQNQIRMSEKMSEMII